MACLTDRYCSVCKKKTQHIDYPDNYYGADAGCQDCFERERAAIAAQIEADEQQQIKKWSEMTLEEKVEDLNDRLKSVEIRGMTF